MDLHNNNNNTSLYLKPESKSNGKPTHQAKIYHKELNIEGECQYLEGWPQKFKKCHGVKYLKICGENASVDYEAAENDRNEFAKVVSDEKLSPEQIDNSFVLALGSKKNLNNGR
ncbi:Hypothetical predicted protein [Octopus vulgaris]|uniref:Uncharacterized protein n=1 Tax=Octopus vulgaris TaxID=6645 RepID=A0AA36B1X2_OCTVU|nr:Hypothetical predicted protein [Octopus vulgaris]